MREISKHDQQWLIEHFGVFDDLEGHDELVSIARMLTPYATQANYPSDVSYAITPELAEEIYETVQKVPLLLHLNVQRCADRHSELSLT